MTKFQALFIKYLRTRCDCTWRAVAAHFYNRYSLDYKLKSFEERIDFNTMTWGGNQIDGMMLCDEAMELLEDKVEDGWN